MLLLEVGVGSSDAERSEIVEVVGGHPQSLAIFQQVLDKVAPEELKKAGVEEVRDWLLRRVLSELPPELKFGLARLSVLGYVASRGEALASIGNMASDVLKGLVRRDLVRVQGGEITVHDALREVAMGILSPLEVAEVHKCSAAHLLREIVLSEEKGLLYETGIKWAAHLEAAYSAGLTDPEFDRILKADVQLLRDLFAISTRGFPYEFEDETLAHTWDRIQLLINQGLVKRIAQEGNVSEGLPCPVLILDGLSKYQRFLTDCLCLLHGYSNHVGYQDDIRPNYSFEIQRLDCPWEHCIELLPLPPVNAEDHECWVERLKAQLLDAEQRAGSESFCKYLLEFIAYVTSPESTADHGKGNACPWYGHWCPGGREQASYCQSQQNEIEDGE
jgi:hypothetical protein